MLTTENISFTPFNEVDKEGELKKLLKWCHEYYSENEKRLIYSGLYYYDYPKFIGRQLLIKSREFTEYVNYTEKEYQLADKVYSDWLKQIEPTEEEKKTYMQRIKSKFDETNKPWWKR